VLRRVICEPVVVRGGRGGGVRGVARCGEGEGENEKRGEDGEEGEEFDVEEGKVINVCWEGRVRTGLILSW